MSFARRVAAVGGWTLISRIFGFTRDVLMASILGAGFAADAFFIAFKLPNFFRRLFGEGAFAAGFVPVFSALLGNRPTAERRLAAERFAGDVLGWLLPSLLLVLIAAEVFMGAVMVGLTGGFSGDTAKLAFVTELGRYAFPYLLFISLVAMAAGILNAAGRFAAPAFVPILLNVAMITALLTAGGDSDTTARWLAVAVSISGAAQLLWLFWDLRRAHFRLRLRRPALTPDVKAMFAMIGPAAIGAGVTQINLLIDIILAARYLPEGSVSWLFYADRLSQLTVGVVGVAIGTVLLPQLSAAIADKEETLAARAQNQALALALLLALPATCALIAIPLPLISGLFERAAFTAGDSAATAAALVAYAAGLPAFVLLKVLTPGFLARRDSRTPVRVAMLALGVNLTLNLVLIGPLAHVGLAVATSVAAWVNTGILAAILIRRGHFHLQADSGRMIVRSGVAAALMAALLAGGAAGLSASGLPSLAVLGVLVAAGLAVYGAALKVMGIGPAKIRAVMGR